MKPMRFKWLAGLALVVTTLISPAPARADLLGNVVRGFQLFDYRFSGERNLLGDGWTINADAFYNNRRFNMGVADLWLTGQVNSSMGYTLRGIPAAEFSLTTGGQPLTYLMNLNYGVQDATFSGSALINAFTTVNALGFYDLNLQISNRGTLDIEGMLLTDYKTLDYDIGPINVSGNIFADVVATVTDPFFVAAGTENPFAKFSARSAKADEAKQTASQIRSRITAGEIVSDEEIAQLVNNTILAAILNGEPTDNLFDDLIIPEDMFASEPTGFPSLAVAGVVEVHSSIPEAATVGLMALALVGLTRRRRLSAK